MKNNTSVPPGGKDYFAPQITKKKKKLKAHHYHWALKLVLLTLAISMALSFVSSKMLENAGYLPAFLVLTLFVFVGVVFDLAGMAVATAQEKPFHSMATRRVYGSTEALRLIRRAEKVSSFCNDVVGDISSIISGATCAVIAARLVRDLSVSEVVTQLVVSGVVSGLMVGSKALGKTLAMQYNTQIVLFLGKAIRVCNQITKKLFKGLKDE